MRKQLVLLTLITSLTLGGARGMNSFGSCSQNICELVGPVAATTGALSLGLSPIAFGSILLYRYTKLNLAHYNRSFKLIQEKTKVVEELTQKTAPLTNIEELQLKNTLLEINGLLKINGMHNSPILEMDAADIIQQINTIKTAFMKAKMKHYAGYITSLPIAYFSVVLIIALMPALVASTFTYFIHTKGLLKRIKKDRREM